jgi:hypothetical protein
MTVYGGVEVQLHVFSTSELDLDALLHKSVAPSPWMKEHNTYGIKGLLGPTTGTDTVENRKYVLLPVIDPRFIGRPTHNLVNILTKEFL